MTPRRGAGRHGSSGAPVGDPAASTRIPGSASRAPKARGPRPDPGDRPRPALRDRPRPDPTDRRRPDPTDRPKPDPTDRPRPAPRDRPGLPGAIVRLPRRETARRAAGAAAPGDRAGSPSGAPAADDHVSEVGV